VVSTKGVSRKQVSIREIDEEHYIEEEQRLTTTKTG